MRRIWRRSGFVLLLGLGLSLVWLNACHGPLRIEPLRESHRSPRVDEHLKLAREYAPWIYQQSHRELGRQDLPAPIDFDGDWLGENNWDHFPHYRLTPTVYYSALESQSHWFLSYHLFHPRDWTLVDLGVHLTHENDGENLQVVVDKHSGSVVLLYAQAHFKGRVYAKPGQGFAAGKESIMGEIRLLNDAGHPDPSGKHAAVWVEYGGHGIYGSEDDCVPLRFAEGGTPQFEDYGFVLRPEVDGESVREPSWPVEAPVPYRLESLVRSLWPGVRSGEWVGEGRLLDGAVPYEGPYGSIAVPRYYEADRYSGPLGPDRGISPFALDFGFDTGEVGALFFDPARRYAECLQVPEGWSQEYPDYPFRP